VKITKAQIEAEARRVFPTVNIPIGDKPTVFVDRKTDPGFESGVSVGRILISSSSHSRMRARRELFEFLAALPKLPPRRPSVRRKAPFICEECKDTHKMELNEQMVMCTFCPSPCQECRAGGIGPFCEQTPCACKCHATHWKYAAFKAKGGVIP
jgi:hypothetical protein